MAEQENKKLFKKGDDVGGIAFVGCMFVGLGLGLWLGNPGVGVIIGLGTGFIVMALIKSRAN